MDWTNELKKIHIEKEIASMDTTTDMNESLRTSDLPKSKDVVDNEPPPVAITLHPPPPVAITLHPPKSLKAEILSIMWDLSTTIIKMAAASAYERQQGLNTGTEPYYLTSDKYTFVDAGGKSSEWTLLMNPCHIENGIRYVSLYLWMCRVHAPHYYVDISYHLGIVSEQARTIYSKGMSHVKRFTATNCIFGWKKFIQYDKLGVNSVNPLEVIRFQAMILIYSDHSKEKNATDMSQKSSEIGVGQLDEKMDIDEVDEAPKSDCQSFTQLWKDIKTSDMKILTGLHAYQVHTIVLKAMSPVFAKHFMENEGLPNPLKTMEVDGKPNVIEGMLEFCYTRTTQLFSDYATTLDLIQEARRFQIDRLEMRCIEIMMTMVNLENYTSVYNLMHQKKQEEGTVYSTQEFLKSIFEIRKTNPSVLMDYEKDPQICAVIIFGD